MRERLDSWAAEHKDRFKMVYVVGTRWKGMIDAAFFVYTCRWLIDLSLSAGDW